LRFPNVLSVRNGRYFDPIFFNTLQQCWRRGYSKPEVLKHAGKPGFAFQYVLKYFLKQKRNKGLEESLYKSSRTKDTPWKLRGEKRTYFAMPIRLLAWSRGMQDIYKDEQLRQLSIKLHN
jgi:hypothetical protein